MSRILILFAHPLLENSRANRALLNQLPDSPGITFHDLYEQYPDFNVDISREKEMLEAHDLIVWQHPLYWYSAPALLKQWIDMVLEYGWAYGTGGTALKGKRVMNLFTSGGARHVYCEEGYNRYTIREFLRPFEQTACLCKMEYLPPFAVQGTHKLSDEALKDYGRQYGELLQKLEADEWDATELHQHEFLNDLLIPNPA